MWRSMRPTWRCSTTRSSRALGEEEWASARFVFHPGMSIAVFEWNTLEIWHALDQEGPAGGRNVRLPTDAVSSRA